MRWLRYSRKWGERQYDGIWKLGKHDELGRRVWAFCIPWILGLDSGDNNPYSFVSLFVEADKQEIDTPLPPI